MTLSKRLRLYDSLLTTESLVQQALKERKRLHVLHFDWYEFSCTNNKKEPEKEYSMRQKLAAEKAKEREKARAERGRREGLRFVNTSKSHAFICLTDTWADPCHRLLPRLLRPGDVPIPNHAHTRRRRW